MSTRPNQVSFYNYIRAGLISSSGNLSLNLGSITAGSGAFFRVFNNGQLDVSTPFIGGNTVNYSHEFAGSFDSLGVLAGQEQTIIVGNNTLQ